MASLSQLFNGFTAGDRWDYRFLRRHRAIFPRLAPWAIPGAILAAWMIYPAMGYETQDLYFRKWVSFLLPERSKMSVLEAALQVAFQTAPAVASIAPAVSSTAPAATSTAPVRSTAPSVPTSTLWDKPTDE